MHSPEEKALAPRIRFSGFTDAWEQRRLRDITERVTAACDDAKLPRVEYEDIDSGEGTLNKPIGNLGHSRAGVAFLRGDVLYGKLRPYLHNWLFPQFEGIALGDFWVLRPKAVDPSYLYRLVQSSAFDELANISAGSKMPRADWHLVGDANFALPPNSVEQRKIGALFSCLDDLIALHQRKCDGMKTVKKSLLEKMFPREGETTPELRFAGFTDAWEQRRLGDICAFSKGRGYSKDDLRDAGVPVILYGRLYTQYETQIRAVDTFADELPGSQFSSGDEVIVPASGETAEDIAVASSVRLPGIMLGGDLNIVKPGAQIDQDFLALGITYGSAHRELSKRAQGKSVVHLHGDDIAAISFPFPSKEEQEAVSSAILVLDDLIALHQRKLNVLKNVKKSLLEGMFV